MTYNIGVYIYNIMILYCININDMVWIGIQKQTEHGIFRHIPIPILVMDVHPKKIVSPLPIYPL